MNNIPKPADEEPFEKSRNSMVVLGIIMICVASFMLIWFGTRNLPFPSVLSSLFTTPTITAASAPIVIMTSMVEPTQTPLPTMAPTHTPYPTPTATRPPSWVNSFAEPILSAIANQTPKVQDDFPDNSGGWHSDLNRVDLLAPIKFIDDALVLNNCAGYRSKMGYKDFVLEVDGRFVQGTKGNPRWRLVFRAQGPANPQYAIVTNYAGYLDISMHDEGFQSDPLYVNRGPENNHILLIAKGTRFALYANGRPLYYWQHTKINQSGYIYFDATTEKNWNSIIALDNLKIWDISNLP